MAASSSRLLLGALREGAPRTTHLASALPRAAHLGIACTSSSSASSSASRTFSTSRPALATNSGSVIRDGQIPFSTVHIRQEDGKLSEPRRLRELLGTYDVKTHTLQLVSNEPPIVRLVAKKDLQQNERQAAAKAKARRQTSMHESDLQVTWESAPGDLDHKLAQAKSILQEGGDRLKLAFSSNAKSSKSPPLNPDGTPKPPPPLTAKQESVATHFLTSLEPIAKEWRDRHHSHKSTVFYLQPRDDIREEHRRKVEEALEAKESDKERKKRERREKEEERRRKAEERRSNASSS